MSITRFTAKAQTKVSARLFTFHIEKLKPFVTRDASSVEDTTELFTHIVMNRSKTVFNNQHDYTNELCRKLRLAHSSVESEMKTVVDRYEKLNAKLTSRMSFEIGDRVWRKTVPKPNVNRKLFHPFDGTCLSLCLPN